MGGMVARVETVTMTLSEFLLARIAEDEGWASAAAEFRDRRGDVVPWSIGSGPLKGDVFAPGHARIAETRSSIASRHIARHDPARVLAECEAKRRIVERHNDCGTGYGYCDDGGHGWAEGGCADLADLALPYADHPDYRDEWKP